MRRILTNISSENNIPKYLISSGNTGQIRHIQRTNKDAFANRSIIEGDYSFGSCDFADGNRPCSYFTMLRDPIERLISSFFYCKQVFDQLCGPISAENMTIEKWAMHQGSYFFRQLLIHPDMCSMDLRKVVGRFRNRTRYEFKYRPDKKGSCWFTEKAYLEEKVTKVDRMILLQYCLENIENWFAVVGILEEFELSLKMFESVYELPFTNFAHTQANRGALSASHDKSFLKNLSLELRHNDMVMNALYEDLALYEKVSNIFEKQKNIFDVLHETGFG